MKAKGASAMVLAAGLGTRMRPITETMPKPLVRIAGTTLLDRALDTLAAAGVTRAVVNVHHFADQVERHVAARETPHVAISNERAQLLDSAGGIVRALPLLGEEPFFVLNADTFWIDEGEPNLERLAARWDDRCDILLMLVALEDTTGHGTARDFVMDGEGRLARAGGDPNGLVYAGAAIVHPRIFKGAPAGPHSLNLYFDRAIKTGSLYGMIMRGHWITVGTPEAIAAAEAAVGRHSRAAS